MVCQSECACLHETVNMVVFFVKSNENTCPKGRALKKMYKWVVPQKERGNILRKLNYLFSVYMDAVHRSIEITVTSTYLLSITVTSTY